MSTIARTIPPIQTTVSALPDFKVGDRVHFNLFCFGQSRLATGVVVPLTTQVSIPIEGGSKGDRSVVREAIDLLGVVAVSFEFPAPPIEELHKIYHEHYPADGICRGEIQIPADQCWLDVLGGKSIVPQILPLEHQSDVVHDVLAQLEQERDRLSSQGLAPEGAWIETGKSSGKRKFRQAWWRASKPIFTPKRGGNVETKVKSCYIGEDGSPEHQKAIERYKNRKQYESICRQIELLEKEL